MTLFRKFAHGVRALCWKKRMGDELEEELHSFIEAAVEQKKGFSVIDSRLFFGGITELLVVQKLPRAEAP
jgi:hypothetical protein